MELALLVLAIIALIPSPLQCHPIRHARHRTEQASADEGSTDDRALAILTLSEINTDSAQTPPKRFIELSLEPVPGRVPSAGESLLGGWRLLMIKGSTLEVVMSIDLAHHLKSPKRSFVVIGDSNIPNVDISFASHKTEIAFTPSTFPDMDISPFAIVLLGAMDIVTSQALTLPTHNGAYVPLNIANDDDRKKIISDLAWDAVVVGRRTRTNQCDFFSSLFPKRSFKDDLKYLLRDMDTPTSSINDYSLNYCCPRPRPYSPDCFKLGHPSPGLKNDCTGRRFILEFEIDEFAQARQSSVFVDQDQPFCKPDFPGIEPYRYNQIHDHDYAAAVARVMRKPECERPTEYMEIEVPPETRPEASTPPPEDQPLQYIPDFDVEEFEKCQNFFSKPHDLRWRGMYSSWLDVRQQGGSCIIKCRFCRTYFDAGWRPDKKHKSKIQKDGYFSANKYENQKAINKHLKDPVHAEAAHFYVRLASARTRSEQLVIEAFQLEREKELMEATKNEADIGYTELYSDVSFRGHSSFLNLADRLKVNVGFKHRNEKSLSLLSVVFSLEFHKRLLNHLVKEKKYFSLICDGTTNRNIPYLVCLIQTLEDNKPIVYFWGLLVITTGETGHGMVEDLKIRVSEDDRLVPGFEDYFKTHIIASVSDSASNMVGSRISFYAYLNRYVGRTLALVKCGAHKLQRAILHAIDFPTDDPSPTVAEKDRQRYFKTFALINNKFYTFYMSRGSKRFQEFYELAEELEIPAYRINYFFEIRWASSHKRCMETMYKNYDALNADLSEITGAGNQDRGYDQNGKAKASELHKHLLDKTFPVVVAEFVDFLAVFEIMSQRFQTKGGIMIGNVQIIRDGYADFEKLKNEPGSYLSAFLKKCACADLCSKEECTLTDYDNCAGVLRYAGLPTDPQRLSQRTDGQHTINLSQFRQRLYENIQAQLVEYFNPELLEAFEVFNPSNFKSACYLARVTSECGILSTCYTTLPTIVPESISKSPEDSIRILCNFYGITTCDQIISDWKETLSAIVQDGLSQKIKNVDAAQYWPNQIQRDDLPFSTQLKQLLERILVTSFTSADAERAFSMVTKIKSPERQSLSSKSLENLVRVRFNGPPVLSKENLYEYTKAYVKVSSRVDDASVRGGSSPQADATKNYFSKSKLF